MAEGKATDAEIINEHIAKAREAGAEFANYLTSFESYEMAEAISNWLLDASNGSKSFAISKYEDVKANIMKFLDLKDPKEFSLAFEIFARYNMNLAFRVANKAGATYKLKIVLKHFDMLFYEDEDAGSGFIDEMLCDHNIFPSDPQGFNKAKSPEVTTQIFIQVILFMAAVVNGPDPSSVSANPRFQQFQQELSRERQEARSYKSAQEAKTKSLEEKVDALSKAHELQLDALRKEMQQLVLQQKSDASTISENFQLIIRLVLKKQRRSLLRLDRRTQVDLD